MKKVIVMMAAAAMLFSACCTKQCDTPSISGVVMENILARKSVRSYNGHSIPADVMENLLRAAMAAPSGRDLRPWQIVVMTDKSQYETVFEGNFNMQKFMESGAVLILCADTVFTAPTREDPDGPAVRPTRNDTLKYVLSEVLNDLRRQGTCYVKYEAKQSCFHITAR